MNRLFFALLLLALATAYGQVQERVAIINTLDDHDSISVANLTYLTDKLRETAVNVLPADRFGVMTTETIVAFLGSMENTVKVCKEASCLAELGRQVSADYVSQGRIGRFNENLTIKVELYNVTSGNLMGSFTGESENIAGLRNIIDEKAAELFKKMLVEPKAIVVEKPEVAKPEPKPEVPKVKPFPRTSFWVALGLDLAGAAILGCAVYENGKTKEAYDKYYVDGQSGDDYDKAWKKAEDSRSKRDMLYVIGSLVLVSGIGVHIWF
ncbi:MAG: hypothetical protein LBC75_07265 [Fibromonadaceae bacterium]|jgi:TolB-like protein|nr:hypothetical protein [Fibromonadaceae bacterium]